MTSLADDLASDEFWALVEPLLPAPLGPPYGGRHHTISDRACLAAIGRRADERARQQTWRAEAEMWISRLR
jgi:hypothetical protein